MDERASKVMLRNCRVQVEGFGEMVAPPGHLLLETLNLQGIDLHNDCGGQGSCGKCRVAFLSPAPDPLPGDTRHLNEEEINGGVRLACFHQLRDDCSIRVPPPKEVDLLDDL